MSSVPALFAAALVTAALVAMWSVPAVTVTAGTVSVTVTRAGIASIADIRRGVHYALQAGSGTVLAGCTVDSAAVAQHPGGSAELTRTMVCEPNEYHNLSGVKVTVVDTFSPTAGDSVRWTVSISSASARAWGTAITASLGYAAWDNSTRVWLGGPRSGEAPSLAYDAFAPWSLQQQQYQQQQQQQRQLQHVAAGVPAWKRGRATAGGSANASWYIAKGYDATYDCMTGPCVQYGATASYDACRAACDKAKCNVFAWSDRSAHCWFRTDSVWGEKSTRHPYAAVSGCRTGSDPVTGNPWVAGCGTTPPLGPQPSPAPPGGGAARYWYGGQDNDIGRGRRVRSPAEDTASVLPMLTRIDSASRAGVSLLQSPEDTPISAFASAATWGTSGQAWLNWTRLYHRLGGDAMPISFSADFVAHEDDWRPAAAWLVRRYPRFFSPHPAAAATVARISGTGSYADLRGAADLDGAAAQKYKGFGWALNWDSTARFPWHGEWIPTADDGFNETWITCFAHAPPDGHTAEGCTNVSYSEIASWYRHINAMGKAAGTQFSSCQYGNLFEFGWNVEKAWPHKRLDCSPAAVGGTNYSQRLLCHTRRLLQEKYGSALLFEPTDPSPDSGKLVCGGLDGSCIMDPHPDLPYLSHVLDMAKTSMAKVPSSGVCIDRQDWIGVTNPNADDKRTWLPVDGGFMPVRAMIHSWKPAMEAFAQVWHGGGQAVIINDHSNRLDMMEYADGIYAEMGDMSGSWSSSGSLNSHGLGTALASLGPTVAYIWNHPKKPSQMTEEYVCDGLQTHLWAGVFPTVPVKNNDHAIGGDCAPSCDYDAAFTSYGHLFDAIRGRSWVLSAHAAVVGSRNALANLFSVPAPGHSSGGGSSRRLFAAVVVLAPAKADNVTVSLNGLGDGRASSCKPTIDAVLSPMNQRPATAVVTGATAQTAELKLSFTGSNVSHGAAVVVVRGC